MKAILTILSKPHSFQRARYSLLSLTALSPTSFCASSLSIFRWIFPLGFFGILSTNFTPPASLLCLATFSASHAAISCALTFWFSLRAMYARGSSSPLIVTPMTAESWTAG